MKLKFIGPAKDYSGYGEANRHDIAALVSAGVNVTTKLPVYTPEHSDFGKLGQLAVDLENKPIAYRFIVMHVTPNVYQQYMEPEKFHIGRVFWETDKLPLDFAKNCQLLDEIWTGSEYNKQAIRNAGVTVPISIIPEAIDTDFDPEKIEPYIVVNKDDYKFYSVFEWTYRKNPEALLEAFWREFEKTKGVSLTIKTYVDNFRPEKMKEIQRHIAQIKKRLGLKNYAPVYLYTNLMDRHQIYRFHKTFDCYVSAHRGEGWGIPQMEAMLVGNPVITTNVGGIHEYLEHKKTALLLNDFEMIPVNNSRNKQWYTADQNWADVSCLVLLTFRYRQNLRLFSKYLIKKYYFGTTSIPEEKSGTIIKYDFLTSIFVTFSTPSSPFGEVGLRPPTTLMFSGLPRFNKRTQSVHSLPRSEPTMSDY